MTGKTPAELLKEMRLQRAYTLLMQTDKTIAEVSAEVGFELPGYFSSCLKKQYGVLATDFRNEQLSKRKYLSKSFKIRNLKSYQKIRKSFHGTLLLLQERVFLFI